MEKIIPMDSQQRRAEIEASLDRQERTERFASTDYTLPLPPPLPERTPEQLAQIDRELLEAHRERRRERGE